MAMTQEDYNMAMLAAMKSIDAGIKELLVLSRTKMAARKPTPAEPAVDLDGKYGDPIIKAKDPREWSGETMIGRHMSECPPEYLELVAERLDYFASREEDPKKKQYNVLDAARARAWAARIESGYKRPSAASDMTSLEDIQW